VSKQFFVNTTDSRPHGVVDGRAIRGDSDTGEVDVLAIEVLADRDGSAPPVIPMFSALHVRLTILVKKTLPNPEINFGLHNPEMIFVTKSSTSMTDTRLEFREGSTIVIDIAMTDLPLAAGPYGLGIGIYDWARRPVWTGAGLSWIEVEASAAVFPTLPPGSLSYMPCSWSFQIQPCAGDAGTPGSEQRPPAQAT
jgi:lipopolysaccharide transport system ATP-binding protein